MSNLYNRIRNSALVQRSLRVLQFLSAAVSLGFFSARLHRIIAQTRDVTKSNGAVEGILAAAVGQCHTYLLLFLDIFNAIGV